ncbi:MAG: hypothetical protein ABJK37_09610 [Paraglaciecola sp.]|uniref:hypothetical protein n=1 Tax=Paraglaciecola sp. TaxID=1920173 RepID=UPI0032976938
MTKLVAESLDILDLSYEIERDSKSGALSDSLLKQGHTLYSPYATEAGQLIRLLPSGKIDRGHFRDGVFVVTKIAPESESDV